MTNFAAYDVAYELVVELKTIIEQLRKHSAEAADQVERAAISILFNVAEGNRRGGRDPKRYFAIAAGSTSEVLAALDLARAWDWRISDERARALIDRERAILWGLCRARHNRHYAESPIMPSREALPTVRAGSDSA